MHFYRSPGFSLSLLTQSTTSSTHYSESHSTPGSIPEDVATQAVHSLLASLATQGCIPPPLQPHTLLFMAASPEDVSRVKVGSFTSATVQMCRDLETIWGVRFLIRRVEAADQLAREEEQDEDEDDEETQSTPAPPAEEFVLSCRGVGVRGHRKAT